ncbi:uncharacterized protein LOC124265757 [Haliotis rubra]|uniref:uncharacterized protein LOC124265757 n=1 Tax=Haliotis rubra TaxID=36100 RepID=UPI001EE53303|nr:uncharacterized protein LOC124265757 [Haliotis rubra]
MTPPTGGGPRANSPSVPEQLVLYNLEGRPSLCGVDGGIDTEDFMNISETAEAPHDGATTIEVDLNSADDMAFSITDIPDLDPTMISSSFLGGEPAGHVKVSTEEEILKEELEKIKDN